MAYSKLEAMVINVVKSENAIDIMPSVWIGKKINGLEFVHCACTVKNSADFGRYHCENIVIFLFFLS